MKRALLLLTSLINLSAIAQSPILTSASAPQPGDVFITQPVDAGTINIGSGGVSQLWDFSVIRDTDAATTAYIVSPATTPYAALYPTSTIAFLSATGTDTAYVYDRVTNSGYTFLGNYYDLVGGVYYDTARVVFEYPLSYGSAFAHAFAGTTDNGDTITGVDSVTADGYGSLRLPYGTFGNVLRLKYVQHYHSINSGAGFYENIDQTQYAYYTQGYHSSLFDIQYTTNNINGTVISATTASYAKGVATGISDLWDAAPFSIYPNPCRGTFTISGDDVQAAEITVTDLTGAVIAAERLSANQQEIPLSTTAKGMYIVTIKSNKGSATRKLIVE